MISIATPSGVLCVEGTRWAERFVGIPYAAGASDFDGADCWGLVRLVFQNALGLGLAPYDDICAADFITLANGGAHVWRAVGEDRRPFDIVTFWDWIGGLRTVAHCGVMVSPAELLHVEPSVDPARPAGSIIVRLDSGPHRSRRAGTFRHRDVS